MISFGKTMRNKKRLMIGILVYNVYFFLYYWSINYLNFGVKGSLIKWSANWQELLFKQLSAFTFEPIGVIQNFGIQFYVVPMNILLGMILGLLVFMNILAVLYIRNLPKQCRVNYKYNGIIGILPSFLTGFVCCAPAFLISLSSILGSSVSFFTSFFKWLLPLSLMMLLYGINKSYKIIRTS